MTKLQPINFKDYNAPRAIFNSIKETGFAVVTNTGIDSLLLKEVLNDYKDIFKDEAFKVRNKFNTETQEGFFPFKSEKAKGAKASDLKEFYQYYPNRAKEVTLTKEMCKSMEKLGLEILEILGRHYNDLHTGMDWQDAIRDSKSTMLRILHYPALDNPGSEEVRAAAHGDINFLTVLPAASKPGLQVLSQGEWLPVETDSESYIINVGDMLEELTDGFYKSTQHRVVNPSDENVARYSMPLFIHPHDEFNLGKRTAGQFLNERLKELGLK